MIWALYQYNKNKNIKQQEKASKIAEDFSNNLMERMALISYVLMKDENLVSFFSSITKSDKLTQFTTYEIDSILGHNDAYAKFDTILNSQLIQEEYNELLKNKYNKSERCKFESNFPLLVENTLNRLEAVCINISSKAAGSQFIYNSLHQSFLYTIQLLSIKISANNCNNIDKYYTNIIQVYNMWDKQKNNDISKFKKTQKKIDKLQNKADNEIRKLLDKKSGTV